MSGLFIIGLPRSRTAWLSVFMSQSGTHFHHEAINGCGSIEEYKDKINGFGDSTTGFDILNCGVLTPGSKVVIIDKNQEELDRCIEWCNKEYRINFNDIAIDLSRKLDAFSGLRIKQSEISDRLQDIWEYLVDTPWHEKYASLIDFNIQVQSTSIDKEAARNLYESM